MESAPGNIQSFSFQLPLKCGLIFNFNGADTLRFILIILSFPSKALTDVLKLRLEEGQTSVEVP